MNENVKCERSPAINYCQKSSQIRLMMHLLSEASICQEMCLEHRLDIFLEKKCFARYYSGSIALATHAPQRVQFIIDGCREALRVILLHEFSKRLKLGTILDLGSLFSVG